MEEITRTSVCRVEPEKLTVDGACSIPIDLAIRQFITTAMQEMPDWSTTLTGNMKLEFRDNANEQQCIVNMLTSSPLPDPTQIIDIHIDATIKDQADPDNRRK